MESTDLHIELNMFSTTEATCNIYLFSEIHCAFHTTYSTNTELHRHENTTLLQTWYTVNPLNLEFSHPK